MKISSEQAMLDFGETFAKNLTGANNGPIVIELIGDVGTGKTTFTRGLAKGLGIKESITSPSFTISKSYALPKNDFFPNGATLTHYDFYRLADPGIMTEDLAEKLKPNNIIIIEWGDSITNLLPKNHTIINIIYNDDGTRKVTLS